MEAGTECPTRPGAQGFPSAIWAGASERTTREVEGSVRVRASKYRLSRDAPIQGHAACKTASTVAVLRRNWSLRRSAGTCWWWREQGRRKFRPPLCEKRPYTQPSPRRPGLVVRALTELTTELRASQKSIGRAAR